MENIYSIIDMGKLGLDIERLKLKIFAENISNVSNPSYIRQVVDFERILLALEDASSGKEFSADSINNMKKYDSASRGAIHLDQEVVNINNAEMRYKVISQMLQKKFGLLELAMNGGKK